MVSYQLERKTKYDEWRPYCILKSLDDLDYELNEISRMNIFSVFTHYRITKTVTHTTIVTTGIIEKHFK
jgi:hypothetical protein